VSPFKAEWLNDPVSERVRVRRSTALLAIGFVALGLVYLHTHPDPDADPPERVVVAATTTSTDPTTKEDP
jgi:hypothetical protein